MADSFGFSPMEVLLFRGESLDQLTSDMPLDVQWDVVYSARCYAIWKHDLTHLNPLLKNSQRLAKRWDKLISGFGGPVPLDKLLTALLALMRYCITMGVSVQDIYLSDVVTTSDNLLHVSRVHGCVTFSWLYAKLSLFGRHGRFWVGSSSHTAATMIEGSRAVNGPDVAISEMVEAFHLEVKSSLVVTVSLTPREKKILERELGFVPLYKQKTRAPRNHPVLAALREVMRQEYAASSNILNTKLKTLVIGAASREVNCYSSNPSVHYYFANKDSKDLVRTTLELLHSALATKYRNMESGERELMNNLKGCGYIVKRSTDSGVYEVVSDKDVAEVLRYAKTVASTKRDAKQKPVGKRKMIMSEATRRTIELHELSRVVAEEKKIPNHFHFDERSFGSVGSFTQLVCEDVGYNFSVDAWLHLFNVTGAQTAVGYMALPNELLFEHYPISDYYDYWEGIEKHGALGGITISPLKNGQVVGMPKGVFQASQFCNSAAGLGIPGSKMGTVERIICHMSDGFGNGYNHVKSDWQTLLKNPILASPKYNFAIEVDLQGRYGCLATFRLTRVTGVKYVARTIKLRPEDRYVRVLDLLHIVRSIRQKGHAGLREPYQYFPVYKREVDTTVSYCFSIAEKSLTVQNIANFIRHHIGGVSLVNKELVSAWRLNPQLVPSFAYAVYFYVINLRGELDGMLEKLMKKGITWSDRLKANVSAFLRDMVDPISFLWTWLFERRLVDQIFEDGTDVFYQMDRACVDDKALKLSEHLNVTRDFMPADTLLPEGWVLDDWEKAPDSLKTLSAAASLPIECGTINCVGKSFKSIRSLLPPSVVTSPVEQFFKAGGKFRNDSEFAELLSAHYRWQMDNSFCACQVCSALTGQTGSQVVECRWKEESLYTFSMSQTEVDDFRNEVKAQSIEKGNRFGELLVGVHQKIPTQAFEVSVRLEYIKGGPGTGKSFLIRSLADPIRDLVVAPFIKLRSDYQNQRVGDDVVSWDFHTPHKALDITGKQVIFVDEFTAYDWRLLAVLAYRNHAHTIYLVGDEQQTGIQEGRGEGVSILNRIDLSKISTHVPIMNFRNPVRDVKVLNYLFGARMVPMSSIEQGFCFGDIKDFSSLSNIPDTKIVHYSDETGEHMMPDYVRGISKTTVRANQGSTYDNVVLPVLPSDLKLINSQELNLVALSRHKNKLTILLDNDGMNIGATLKGMIEGVPEELERKDYIIGMYLGNHLPIKKEFFFPESEFAKSFRLMVAKYEAFVPYDSDLPTLVSQGDVVVLDVSRVENDINDTFECADFYNLISRPNNCLVVAISECLGVTLEKLDNLMQANVATISKYHNWLRKKTPSTWEDCRLFADALKVSMHVKVLSDKPYDLNYLVDGAASNITLHLLGKESDGHFVAAPISGGSASTSSGNNNSASSSTSSEDDEEFDVTNLFADSGVSPTDMDAFCGFLEATIMTYFDKHDLPNSDWAHPVDGADGYYQINVEKFGLSECCQAFLRALDVFKLDSSQKKVVYKWLRSALKDKQFHWRATPGNTSASSSGSDVDNDFVNLAGGKTKSKSSADVAPADTLRQSFMDYASEFIPILIADAPAVLPLVEPDPIVSKCMVPEFDAFLLIKEFDLDNGADEYQCSYLNEAVANRIGDKFVSGVLDTDIISPLNLRGHPVSETVKYHSMCVAPAQIYFKRNQWQELQVQQARYLFRKVRNSPSSTQDTVARMVAQMFVSDCLVPNVAEVFSTSNLWRIMDKAMHDMVTKNYQGQMEEEFTRNARLYRFQLKDIEKPLKDSETDLAKAGQGILAWSKEAHVKFMVAFRVLNDLLLKSLNSNVVYDNTMSEVEFVANINAAMSTVPGSAINGVIDAAACDSGQGVFTQLIERYIYSALGISDFFLDWYFSFRERYIMQSRYVRAHMSYVKTSGEPGTLLGNTILMGAMLNAMLRGTGPFCMAMKGDDGFKRQANLKINTDILKLIKKETVLDFKLDLNVPITFCGYALSNGHLFPSVSRKLTKIAAHRFREYKHFCEYQESLRDWIKNLPKDPNVYADFLECNASLSCRTTDDVQRWLDAIISVSRIGYAQFMMMFPLREVAMSLPPVEDELQVLSSTKVNVSIGENISNFVRKVARVDMKKF
ncbi:polyprotein [Beet soil-borne mosaic virus]|uniref:Polyprotein n=1 Tax=Beet soil-borne mosaic virus TaxID=76343 RepID=G1BIV1_9VIRU|nr:polyprotein [Beet soil-borne mosaic virus]AEK48983.1 polyprotein [Beet soil-borne mosaic virus]WIW79797.1 replication-associated protein [Beet soil-borne mosaic virus]